MAPSITTTTPPVVLALALASALYLLLALVKFLARTVPRFLENAKAVPRLSIDLDDGMIVFRGLFGAVFGFRSTFRPCRATEELELETERFFDYLTKTEQRLEKRLQKEFIEKAFDGGCRRTKILTFFLSTKKKNPLPAEANDVISAPLFTPTAKPPPPGTKDIPCYDPSTMQSLGTVPAATPADVARAIADCRAASKEWARSSFAQRRALMRVLLKYTVDNQETICR